MMRMMKNVWARMVVSVVAQVVGRRGLRRVLIVRVRLVWFAANISVTVTYP